MTEATDSGGIDPFRLLPSELVVAIVSYIHDETIQMIQTTVRNLRKHRFLKPILPLASVSRWLRDVIISEPAFWCYINVVDPGTKLEAISTILKRSRDYPLEIVWLDRLFSRTERNFELFEALSNHSYRWRAVTLLASSHTCLTSLVEDISTIHTPMLAKFHIANLGHWRAVPGVTELSLPGLKSLRVANHPLSSMKIGFGSITRLELATSDSDSGRLLGRDVIKAAKALTSLEHLSLNGAFAVAAWDGDEVDKTNWESLHTLILRDKKFYLWRYLASMNCPNLHRLTLLDAGRFDFPIERMNHIITHFPQVEVVELVSVQMQPGYRDSWALSEAFPRLSRLLFSYERYPSDLEEDQRLDTFFQDIHEGNWPCLETLELGPILKERWMEDIASFLEGREEEGHPLTAVGIPGDHPEMEDALKGKGQVTLFTCSVPTLGQYEITSRE